MSDSDTPPPMDDPTPEENPPSVDETAAQEPAAEAPAAEAAPPAEEPAPSVEEPAPTFSGGAVGLGQGTLSESDEKTMSLLAHILGGITSVLGPLIIWLIKKDESPFVNDQGKEALNFQITVLIGYVAAGVVAFLPVVGCISAILYPAIGIASLVFAILGGMEANKGVAYRYPFAARFVS